MKLSEQILSFRRKSGMSQAQFASLAGIAPAVLSRIETGQVSPISKTIYKINSVMTEDKFVPIERKNKSEILCLDSNEILIVEKSVTFGFTSLLRKTVKSNINSPKFNIGDIVFADQEQIDFSKSEGWYIFKQQDAIPYFVAYATSSYYAYGKDVHLSFQSNIPDLGWIRRSQFQAFGKIVKVVKTL